MNFLSFRSLSLMAFIASTVSIAGHAQPQAASTAPSAPQNNGANQPVRIGIVNTKKCLEQSKIGKQEQASFEKMKAQMQSVLQEKERALEEVESKLNDDDYMDSVSEETANELNRQKRTIRNEGMQLQNQYMQSLQQANMMVIQKLTEIIGKASALVAQDTTSGQQVDLIFTDEACTYFVPRFDISDRIIAKMDAIFDAEQSASKTKPAAAP